MIYVPPYVPPRSWAAVTTGNALRAAGDNVTRRWLAFVLILGMPAVALAAESQQSLSWEAWLTVSNQAYQQGRFDEALRSAQAAVTAAERFGPDDPRLATSLHMLGWIYDRLGRYAEAEPFYKRAIAITEKVFGPEDPDLARSLSALADNYQDQGRLKEAEPLFKKALRIIEGASGGGHPMMADVLASYASLLREMNRHGKAEKLSARAEAIRAGRR